MDEQKRSQLIKLGNIIKRLRIERGWSQDELATKCGYSTNTKRSMISAIENGKTDLTTTKLKAFADAFGITGGELISMVDDQERQDVQKICDLFERCYGKESYQAVQMFLKLDQDDRQDIVDLMVSKLHRDKYNDTHDVKTSKGDASIIA